MGAEIILEAKGLTKSFGGVKATDKVNLAVQRGHVHAIIGPNGAGKTTLFNLITGYIRPDSGRVIFKGEDITKLAPWQICRKGIARSFQRVNIYPRLSVLENVRVAVLSQRRKCLSFFSPAKRMFGDQVLEILDSVGLSEQAAMSAGSLAHGDQKRLELAIALGNEPELLLLDEPTAGMSPEETRDTVELIEALAGERGLTVLFTEHDMAVVFSISKRITVMHQGAIIADGEPEEVRRNKAVQKIYLGEAA